MARIEFRKTEKNNTETNENKESKEEIKEDVDDTLQNYYAEWSTQHEKILVEWADKAIVYRWLHSASHLSYASRTRWFTIPVIIVSTLTGTANFAQERVPLHAVPWYNIAVGTANIIAGIVTTIQQFLKINELNESHRVSSIAWDKFYRNIKLELAKSRNERIHAYQMLKISKEEFDRLMETSPSINTKMIKKFYDTFSGGKLKENQQPTNKQIAFDEIFKPEICNVLHSTRHSVYKETAEDIAKNKTKKLVNYVKENNEFRKKSIIVDTFINDFSLEYNREPTFDEIHDNLQDKVSNTIINNIMNKNNNTNNTNNTNTNNTNTNTNNSYSNSNNV
tara:strand:- start:9688 stop:10695 length:1008 start_codon:yes stop_codon:yes gene_type:complete